MASSSTNNLDEVLASIDLVPESSYVREEATLITEAPLAIMAPPSYAMSSGSCLETMARSKVPLGGTKEKKVALTRPTTSTIGLKWKAPEDSRPSKHFFVMPLGNSVSRASSSMHTARPSPSYIVVGVRKSEGGLWKGAHAQTG
jgi:hypothetical protein